MEQGIAQFSFAINQKGLLTHISEASRGDTYLCCDCDQVMIPVLGDIRTHHFRHSMSNCSYESYLHKAAKLAFLQRFNDAKNANSPISLELERTILCKSRKASLLETINVSCRSSVLAHYNLTSLFDIAELEKFDAGTGLTPDVLLSSPDDLSRKCYVEIHVTHPCSEDKINCSIPIIEFDVNDDKDIEYIRSDNFSISDPRVTLYHFNNSAREVSFCHEHCQHNECPIGVWALSQNGRLNKKVIPLANFDNQQIDENYCWPEGLESQKQTEKIINFLEISDPESYFPNCIRCSCSGSWSEGKLSCTKKGFLSSYTEARKCKDYEV